MYSLSSKLKNKFNFYTSSLLHRKILNVQPNCPVVTFTFDDFPKSSFENGCKILNRHDSNATFFISMQFMNRTTTSGPSFNETDLVELIKTGHEIGCHTFGHLDASKNSINEFVSSIKENSFALNSALGFNYNIENFSYPFGRYHPKLKKNISSVFHSARSGNHGINFGKSDLYILKACKLYGVNDKTHNIKNLINLNKKINGWLIFYTHDVSLNPSEFGTSPELLNYCYELALESGAQILNIKDALNFIKQINY